MSLNNWDEKLLIDQSGNVPISTQLADQLRWLAVTKVLKPGDKLPTIRMLSELLDINIHTVRAAYEKLEKRGIIDTIRGKGSIIKEFNPVEQMDVLSQSPSNTIGVIIPNMNNPFYTEFLNGVDIVARNHRIVTIVYHTENTEDPDYNQELNLIANNMLIGRGVDGLIVGPINIGSNNEWNYQSAEYFKKMMSHVVFVDWPEVNKNVVNLDAENAGYEATEHLLSHGHRNIALITGKTIIPTLNNCVNGYRRALRAEHLTYDEKLVEEVPQFTFEAGYCACKELLQRRGNTIDFSAIFVAGDTLSVGALKALREHNLVVPDDIALVSYNNINLSNYTYPPLTTVSAPIQEMGIKSMEMLIKTIKNEPVPQDNLLLPTKLVIRQSCGCPT